MFHDHVFTNAIAPDGSLSPELMDYASALFAQGRAKDPTASMAVDNELERGRYADMGAFKELATFGGYVDMRTQLQEFTIDEKHAEILARNRHLSLHFHTDVEAAAHSDSEHFRLRSLYQKTVFQTPLRHQDAAADLIRNTRTPGMQSYMLDVYDEGRLVASNVFAAGWKTVSGEYHFYDPALRNDWVGRHAILASSMICKHAAKIVSYHRGLFSPSQNSHMWKLRMQPAQVRIDDAWQPVTPEILHDLKKRRKTALSGEGHVPR